VPFHNTSLWIKWFFDKISQLAGWEILLPSAVFLAPLFLSTVLVKEGGYCILFPSISRRTVSGNRFKKEVEAAEHSVGEGTTTWSFDAGLPV
jgi:hypothetical protein